MRFTSFEFLVFFAVVYTAYLLLRRRAQNVLLLVASYAFYGWVHPWFLLLIGASTLLDYFTGMGMGRFPERKRVFLAISIAGNMGLLGTFKYFNFFVANAQAAFDAAGLSVSLPVLQIALPVGISFYTFQELSYAVDVYRGHLAPRRNLIDFALFVSFFPQLVAGPIERATNLLPQLERDRRIDFDRVESGVCLAAWGFFKKLVVADNLVIYVDRIFELPHPSGIVLLAGALAFAVQILTDFSGYTDIARGVARMLGFELMENFRAPYLATSPSDFWRRWHISFSSWIRDYLYIPLGGSRGTRARFVFAAMCAMTLSGLWHGASWNFVLWGVYHGLLVVVYHLLFRRMSWTPSRWLAVCTMFPLTLLGWVIFRQHDTAVLFSYADVSLFSASAAEWSVGLGLIATTVGLSLPLMLRPAVLALAPRSLAWRAALAWCCVIAIVFFGRESGVDFIYFAF